MEFCGYFVLPDCVSPANPTPDISEISEHVLHGMKIATFYGNGSSQGSHNFGIYQDDKGITLKNGYWVFYYDQFYAE
jgi:hypothetical protein